MLYEIEFVREAKSDLKRLRKIDKVKILDRIETHLRYEPMRKSKSRIKQLRGDLFPLLRLRVDDFRVYYEVDDVAKRLVIYGVIHKKDFETWLTQRKNLIEGRKER